jgi:hypothetical protein
MLLSLQIQVCGFFPRWLDRMTDTLTVGTYSSRMLDINDVGTNQRLVV